MIYDKFYIIPTSLPIRPKIKRSRLVKNDCNNINNLSILKVYKHYRENTNHGMDRSHNF